MKLSSCRTVFKTSEFSPSVRDAYTSHLKDNGLWTSYIHTYDVSMNYKARPKAHIAVKSAEVHPKTSSKTTSHNATLLPFVIIVPIIGKT